MNDAQLSVRIANATFGFADVYKQGNTAPVRTLAPREFYTQETTAGDVWVVQSQGLSGQQITTVNEYTQFIEYDSSAIQPAPSGSSVSVTFTNNGTVSVRVLIMTPAGQLADPTPGQPLVVTAGQSSQVSTQAGAVFRVFTATTGQEMLLYVATADATQTCSIQLRSINSNQSCGLTFINSHADAVNLYWLDYSGAEVSYGTLPSGSSLWIGTYAGHPWVVRSADNTDVLYFTMCARPNQDVVVAPFQPYDIDPLIVQALGALQNANLLYLPLRNNGLDCWYRSPGGGANAGVVFNTNGEFGYAADFSAAGASVILPPDFEFYYVEDGYTVSCWVNVATLPSSGQLATLVGQLACDSTGKLQYALPYVEQAGGTILGYNVTSSGTLTTAAWHNIVLTYDGTAQACSIYVDGVLDSTTTIPDSVTSKMLLLPTTPGIGGPPQSDSQNINLSGQISDVSFYEIASGPLHAAILADTADKDESRSFVALPFLVIIPLCLAVVGVVRAAYLVAQNTSSGRSAQSPNYIVNKQLSKYVPGNTIDHLDVWGQGRIHAEGKMITGFTDSYNLEKSDMVVSNGADTGRQIPNMIGVSGYDVGFENAVNQIPADGVTYMTCMGAPINAPMAADMTKAINPVNGVVILYDFNDDSAATLEAALLARQDQAGNVIFEKKLNNGQPITVEELAGKFGEIRMSENTSVRIYAPKSLSLSTLMKDLKDEL